MAPVNVATIQDGDFSFKIDWLGGNDHVVNFFDDQGVMFASHPCESIAKAFLVVYQFGAYEYMGVEEDFTMIARLV